MTLFIRDMANVERGRAEGFAQGREEMKLETARKMRSSGMAPETIVKFIDLPVAEIEKL